MTATRSNAISDDLIEGADRIAEFIWGTKDRKERIYRLKRKKGFPVFNLAGKLCARRSSLLTWIEAQERQAAQ